MRVIQIILIGLFLLANMSFLAREASAQDVIVLVNNRVPENSLKKNKIKNIFLSKKTRWNNGDKIIPVILEEGSAHKTFLKKYVGKSPSQFSAFWKQMIFTGKGTPPRSFAEEANMVNYIAATTGAIGYISNGGAAVGDNVRVMEVR